jgi:hypothetical protein
MSHLDVLLPFSLPPPEIATDLLKEAHAPAFAQLLARGKPESDYPRLETFDSFARALPHEIWLARNFGLESPMLSESSPAIATALMQSFGHAPLEGHWFVVHPVHLHIARDHLVLTDTRRLQLSAEEARTLFDIAREVFAEAGKTLISGNETTWFLRADDWRALQTATPDAATGHNIDIWMPHGPHERAWRKLQNEVQMLWFGHPVNQTREASGLRTVNSIWLWGGADAPVVPVATSYRYGVNLNGWAQAIGAFIPKTAIAATASTALADEGAEGFIVLDRLLAPALANDWSSWLDALQALERDWFAPLLDALKTGRVERLRFVLTDHLRLARLGTTRASLRKFWIKPSFSPLLP